MKIDYNQKMIEIINILEPSKNKLLLHSCCGPCSSYVIERLKADFAITVYYYNPNIEPYEEYLKRKECQTKLLERLNIPFLDADYENELYQDKTVGLENEVEGGKRCSACFELRLTKTALKANQNNFDYFGTTLTVSPHKNSQVINELGNHIAQKQEIPFLLADFKKNNGYQESIKLSQEYGLYRQNYCGCHYSKTQH